MNKSLFIYFAVLVIVLGSSTNLTGFRQVYPEDKQTSEQQQHKQEQLITYTNPQGNYTLQYPQSWKVEYIKPVSSSDLPLIQFRMSDPVSLVSIETNHAEITRKQLRDGFLTYYPLILRERFDGISIENKTFGKYSIDGSPAGSIVFSSLIDKTSGISKGLFVSAILSNNQSISITYISSDKNFDIHIPEIGNMIDSIRALRIDQVNPVNADNNSSTSLTH